MFSTTRSQRRPSQSFALTPEAVESFGDLARELREGLSQRRPQALRHLAEALAPYPKPDAVNATLEN